MGRIIKFYDLIVLWIPLNKTEAEIEVQHGEFSKISNRYCKAA